MVAIGKHLVLRRQKRPARIDEIKAGQPVFAGDFLRAQMLFDGHREIGAAFDRRIIRDDDAFAAHDAPDTGDDAGGRHLAVIHAPGRELREFEKRRARIEECPHPLPRQQFTAPEMPAPRRFPTALADHFDLLPQILDECSHRRGIRRERFGPPVDCGRKNRHRWLAPCEASIYGASGILRSVQSGRGACSDAKSSAFVILAIPAKTGRPPDEITPWCVS